MMSAGRFEGKGSRRGFGSSVDSAMRLIVNQKCMSRIPDSTIFVKKQST
ncbi:hypothetical protein SAMN04488029_1265 [Reichenbachiella faecimaris]|uniref:Uncharacterized protein n=1 Tax=Reichenbachiella faecimaris TaxID=692418 RepID=A0A1W2G894_REIFA|nr:hypothetical protein SAMN04488029_1265 [Reichenbachiella faecimaris]